MSIELLGKLEPPLSLGPPPCVEHLRWRELRQRVNSHTDTSLSHLVID
jgi:hypothetical protein